MWYNYLVQLFIKSFRNKLKNHPVFNSEYIIKNNGKSIKCLLHPEEKNLAFWLECNTHICKEYMKSKKHKGRKKDNIIEVLVRGKKIY